jgi:hypothetical protein
MQSRIRSLRRHPRHRSSIGRGQCVPRPFPITRPWRRLTSWRVSSAAPARSASLLLDPRVAGVGKREPGQIPDSANGRHLKKDLTTIAGPC